MFTVFILSVSITMFITETSFYFRIPVEIAMNKSLSRYQRHVNTVPVPWIIQIELYCNIYFIIELILRFLTCPCKKKFLRNPYTYIDILACMPILVSNISIGNNFTIIGRIQHYIKLFFIIRILKIFVMVPKDNGLKVLLLTCKKSLGELFIYFLMLIMTILIFARYILNFKLNTSVTGFRALLSSIIVKYRYLTKFVVVFLICCSDISTTAF